MFFDIIFLVISQKEAVMQAVMQNVLLKRIASVSSRASPYVSRPSKEFEKAKDHILKLVAFVKKAVVTKKESAVFPRPLRRLFKKQLDDKVKQELLSLFKKIREKPLVNDVKTTVARRFMRKDSKEDSTPTIAVKTSSARRFGNWKTKEVKEEGQNKVKTTTPSARRFSRK